MEFYIVDVFAEQKYQGNQLAVVIPSETLSDKEMQNIANELNYNETTFILSEKLDNGGYDVRIFTPDIEVPFAGHPTIGTAFIIKMLYESNAHTQCIPLNLAVGQINVYLDNDYLTMKQNQPQFKQVIKDPTMMSNILNIDLEDIDDRLPIQVVSTGLPAVIVPVKSTEVLNKCSVNHYFYQSFIEETIKANIIIFSTELSKDKHLVNTRVYLDDSGFPEDPATGSANGNLAAYLHYYNFFDENHVLYEVEQGVKMGRPSKLNIEVSQNQNIYEILVGGKVFLIAKGTWL